MWDILVKATESNEMISIYTDISDQEHFNAGFLEQITEEYFLMKHVTAEGIVDGHIVRRLADVYRVDQHSQYEQKLETLYKIQNQQHYDLLLSPVTEDENLLVEVLKTAIIAERLVSIKISDEQRESTDFIYGFVTSVTDDIVTIAKVSNYGEKDGTVTIFLRDIEAVDCDRLDEITIKLMYQHVHRR
ncbi:hypothetical protein MK805_00900 [Shimazuella sp. AN120528]|uniref:hypothetical protein n=1 Tax=Shimazuella soli TaxID=1892854 RepID=UPI001F107901|nr:hypothetical protein [Shimazuella soli]MCH5583529.1 hypothetical protein [Shimazuella soli]